MRKSKHRGFTLMEVLIVLGILSIIFAITAFISFDTYRGSTFRNERDTIIGTLQRARSQSINNVCLGTCTNSRAHGVHFTNTQYTLFQGLSYASRDTAYDEVKTVNPGIGLSGATDVMFAQLSGDATTTPSGTWELVVKDATGHISTTTVNQYGQIQWTH